MTAEILAAVAALVAMTFGLVHLLVRCRMRAIAKAERALEELSIEAVLDRVAPRKPADPREHSPRSQSRRSGAGTRLRRRRPDGRR